MASISLSRRQFLGGSLAVAGAGFAIGGTRSTGPVLGANDKVGLAVAGLNGRGGAHVDELRRCPTWDRLPRRSRYPDLRQAGPPGRVARRQEP